MKHLFSFRVMLVALFAAASLLFSPTAAAQWESGESISSFDGVLSLAETGELLVEETIIYNFGSNQKHGIYRDIPVVYQDGIRRHTIQLDDITITNREGEPWPFTVSRNGRNKRIKIGDPNAFVYGEQIYVISYRVTGAIIFDEGASRLSWNVTGNDWQVSINQARVRVHLPTTSLEGQWTADCYAGVFGSTQKCMSLQRISSEENIQGIVASHSNLYPGDGVTVTIGLPAGVLTPPTSASLALGFLRDNGIIALPIVTLMIMAGLWYHRGRDPKGRGTVITQFDPPKGLSPAALGLIMDEHINARDVTAEIIQLAIDGYLTITPTIKKPGGKPKDFALEKQEKSEDVLPLYRQQLLKYLFPKGKITYLSSILTPDSKKELIQIKETLYKQLTDEGYFSKNPHRVRRFFTVPAIMIGATFIAVVYFAPEFVFAGYAMRVAIPILLSAGILYLFGRAMPARTHRGVLAREYILGLKNYIAVAEKDRLSFHNAPNKSPEVFETLLPFAVALNVEKEWAKQFAGLGQNYQPSWYISPFDARMTFASSFNSFTKTANTGLHRVAYGSKSRSGGFSGGGFSGGGFGGGGGGSW